MSKLSKISRDDLILLVKSHRSEIKYLECTLNEVLEANKKLVRHSDDLVEDHDRTMRDMADLIRNLVAE